MGSGVTFNLSSVKLCNITSEKSTKIPDFVINLIITHEFQLLLTMSLHQSIQFSLLSIQHLLKSLFLPTQQKHKIKIKTNEKQRKPRPNYQSDL